MLNLEAARAVIGERLPVALAPESVELSQACGRVVRESIAAPEDLPAFDRSAYDGYALRSADAPGRLRVTQEIAAGAVAATEIGAGECARIFTGAQLPPGADCIAMQEQVQREGGFAVVPATPCGFGVRVRGEDARAGDLLLSSGCKLGAIELALCAQLGHVKLLVAARPRVFHVVTGSELVPPHAAPGAGQIRDSNSTLVAALCVSAGIELTGQCRAGDDLETLVTALHTAERTPWHVLLISGGASVGDYDFGARALRELGFTIHFTQLNLRPGKPLIFAARGGQAAFVIPGNPLSHFVCWHLVIRAAFDALMKNDVTLPTEILLLDGLKPLRGNPRETWWPGQLVIRDGQALVRPLKWQSSGDLTGLVGADRLIRIPSDSPGIEPGQPVLALPV